MALPLFVASHRFDPRSIPGLESWWDAADAASVTLDAGRVSQLADKSGNGRHAANTTSGSTQPSYVTGARNGLNVARFAAASVQRLTVASSTAAYNFLHNGTPSWFIAVSSYGTNSNPNTFYALFGNNVGASTVGVFYSYDDRSALGNNAANIGVRGGTGVAVNTLNSTNSTFLTGYNNVLPPQQYLVQEAAIDATSGTAANRFRFRVNGSLEVAENNKTAATTTANAVYDMQIGALGNNVGPLEGDICELLMFSQIPTAAARDLIRRYLGSKWGIALA